VYFFAGITKIFAAGWTTGQVLALSLSSRWATGVGLWAATRAPAVLPRAFSLLTILYELLAPWLLFVPWARRYAIVVGLCLHVGIQGMFGVGWLGAHFILALLALYPDPATLRGVVERVTAAWSRVSARRA